MEIWKDINGYEGIYTISSNGKIKSLISNKILKPNQNRDGYRYVMLYKNKKAKIKYIHRLVAENFIEGYAGQNINHKTGDKMDNSVSNLEISFHRENCIHRSKFLIKDKVSKYIGVWWNKQVNKWQSEIRINGKKIYLGRFIDEFEAHMAYQKALGEINYTGKYR